MCMISRIRRTPEKSRKSRLADSELTEWIRKATTSSPSEPPGYLPLTFSIPDDPVIVGEMAVNNSYYASAEIVDNLLFAVGVILDSEERSGVLDIIDISNPIHPKTAGSITLHQNIALNIEIIGSLSYIACGSGVAVVDVSKQESPKLLSALDATQGRANWGVKILETE